MVKPKKYLGQHFLKDDEISSRIARSLTGFGNYDTIIEIGAGTGALTKFLLYRDEDLIAIEVDDESILYLKKNYPNLQVKKQDFLSLDLAFFNTSKLAVIGNFPYNISSQILFKIIDHRYCVSEMVGMFQKEVAERIVEPPGTKKYGIISVLVQAYFNVEYLFTVDENVFHPPPKVKSGVIRLQRNNVSELPCNEKLFKQIVKTTFNQRRKKIRNSIRSLLQNSDNEHELFTLRPEQLSVNQFIELTIFLESLGISL